MSTMDHFKLLLKLFTVCYIFSTCIADSCNSSKPYEVLGKCYDSCPSGKNNEGFCRTQCTWNASSENLLCTDTRCSKCMPKPQCQGGEELTRTGNFLFNYVCIPCPDNEYSNGQDTCEPIADCKKYGLAVLFPGDKTHNAKCGWQDSDDHAHKILMVCLAINGLICLVLLFNVCIQRCTYSRKKNKRSVGMPHEECCCKLSKEEKGDLCYSNSHSDLSDVI